MQSCCNVLAISARSLAGEEGWIQAMPHRSRFFGQLILLPLMLAAALPALSQVSVLTRGYDNQRTGANLAETILNQSNVNASQFGKLFQLEVDEQVFAQVLYMHGLTIAGGTHNVAFVATANN